ncbi:peptidoglycan-binding protein [Catenulispora sp. NF23]|uniref:Peptidoglycan-binding protein n=1 Tax=Catenulispora pinistramenti TaxID=2705254 RepID=A0ABS5KYQ4_9ACTN|nr:peptidoglycan-binding domain-containing protein [Catenulispora pinistramenti]MBS2534728.1 peptidoglycan-binding protein [Catenulispora pinistramenti]MBS2551149.1 peptidoglycan-binding protein [Catenulispora pinistramenti]
MTNLSLRRRVAATVVGILAVGGTTLMVSEPAHAAMSTACQYTPNQPQLYVGSQGTAVKQAQCELNFAYALGHSTNYGNGSYNGVSVDGDFGSNTEAATKNFQIHCMGATNPDGIIGPNTWNALNYWVLQPHYC